MGIYLKKKNTGQVWEHTYNPRTQETEAGGSQVLGQLGEYGKHLSQQQPIYIYIYEWFETIQGFGHSQQGVYLEMQCLKGASVVKSPMSDFDMYDITVNLPVTPQSGGTVS